MNSHSHRIWLLDLARTLPPTAQLDGFDIDISDCPPEQWLPRNVTMRHLDALGEIPEHLAGKYDIVQLRLFQVVVKDNDPGPLLRNMVKMLSGCFAFPPPPLRTHIRYHSTYTPYRFPNQSHMRYHPLPPHRASSAPHTTPSNAMPPTPQNRAATSNGANTT